MKKEQKSILIEEKRSILIVDDYDAMRKIIMNYLKKLRPDKYFHAANGVDALSICSEQSIDLIITDLNMPEMGGLELLMHIRATANYRHIPVLMVTAETNQDHVGQAIAAGVNDFLVKPFTPEALHQKIKLIFSNKAPFLKSPLPKVKKDNAVVTQAHLQRESSLSLPKILVVDDLVSNIDVIVGILENKYQLLIANNGKKALQLAAASPMPDLILLDIMMPEMDGMEVCRQLKKNPMTTEIPVIFLTTKSGADAAVEGFSLGAADYITKPVMAALLKARVKNHIELKLAKDRLKNQVDTLMENARLREDVERIARHDIKNPLSLIINQSALLGSDPLICMESREIIKEMGTSALTILKMVDASINLYKMETDRYQLSPEPVDIIKVLMRVRDELCHNIVNTEKGRTIKIKLEVDMTHHDGIKVKGEELLCYSLFTNLLKNAVEASGNNESISITISKKEQIIICIHNQAMIQQEIQKYFFGKYVTHGKKQGSGLGTYSAKLMATVQKGSIDFKTSAKEGTTLIVKLPVWAGNPSTNRQH